MLILFLHSSKFLWLSEAHKVILDFIAFADNCPLSSEKRFKFFCNVISCIYFKSPLGQVAAVLRIDSCLKIKFYCHSFLYIVALKYLSENSFLLPSSYILIGWNNKHLKYKAHKYLGFCEAKGCHILRIMGFVHTPIKSVPFSFNPSKLSTCLFLKANMKYNLLLLIQAKANSCHNTIWYAGIIFSYALVARV